MTQNIDPIPNPAIPNIEKVKPRENWILSCSDLFLTVRHMKIYLPLLKQELNMASIKNIIDTYYDPENNRGKIEEILARHM